MMVSDRKDLFDAFNGHETDAVMRHFATDAVSSTVAGRDVRGTRLGGRDTIARAPEPVRAKRPEAFHKQQDPFVTGDRAGSEVPFPVARPGDRTEARGADIFTVRDGRIVVMQAFGKDRPVRQAA